MRMTKQRRFILEEVKRATSHPTSYDIYEVVKDKIPDISLGTVYRNLEFLSSHGYIRRLEISGDKRRYCGNPEKHHHIRCIKCGCIKDVWDDPLKEVKEKINIEGFKLIDYNLELFGLCPECQKKKKQK